MRSFQDYVAPHVLDRIHCKQHVSHVHFFEHRKPAPAWGFAILNAQEPVGAEIGLQLCPVFPVLSIKILQDWREMEE